MTRRRRLLLLSAPVWLLVLLVSVKLLTMSLDNQTGRRAYAAGEHETAASAFDRTKVVNLAEPWVAPYNRGTTAYQQRHFDLARDDLTEALRLVPAQHDCRVRLNLVATHEAIADGLAATGQHQAARQAYEQGLSVLRAGRCGDRQPTPSSTPTKSPSASPSKTPSRTPSPSPSASPSPGGSPTPQQNEPNEEQRREQEKQRADEADPRMEQKRQEQQRQEGRASNRPSYTPRPEPTQSQDPRDSESRSQELDQRNSDARKERQKDQDREQRPKGPDVKKPW
ncbi:hypothetical protein HJ590_10865 [Naumannella sp. ID2617S]|nr:hypothetical protein [Naumannella sp. ID2617S]